VVDRIALLSGFRIKCGMTECKVFDTPLLVAGQFIYFKTLASEVRKREKLCFLADLKREAAKDGRECWCLCILSRIESDNARLIPPSTTIPGRAQSQMAACGSRPLNSLWQVYSWLKTLIILFISSVERSTNFTPIPGGNVFPDTSFSSS